MLKAKIFCAFDVNAPILLMSKKKKKKEEDIGGGFLPSMAASLPQIKSYVSGILQREREDFVGFYCYHPQLLSKKHFF